MKLNICDVDRLIGVNKLQEVESPHIFSAKMAFDSKGLLSNEIFGISKSDRRSTFAYIDLHRKFIHPHIYQKVLMGMFKGIVFLVAGQRYYSVKDGMLVEDEDGWTGLDQLYKHWDEIDWSKSKSANTTSKEVLMSLTRDQVFWDKVPVIPPAYRDVMLAGTMDASDHVNELNTLYKRLISGVASLQQGGVFSRIQYNTQMKIEETQVEIYKYFKNQISKKQGLIRQYLIGKSVDYGVRSVISAPTYNHEHIDDNIVDVEHCAVPISECCSLFYPFIESWLRNFFTREIINDPNLITFYEKSTGKEFTATIKDPEIQFSDKAIKKMINNYCLNPDSRFRVIEVIVDVPTKTGSKQITANMILKGKVIAENNVSTVLHRALTITDLLYLACVETCEKRHVMVSRYPVGTDKGIFFNRVHVQSTKEHIHVIFNGKDYPRYPVIDLNLDTDYVGIQFVDTLVMSHSHCDGMGADYDGDTLSIRGIWSDEANEEAEEIMNAKMSALNITGSNSKVVAKELFNSMFELTKIGKSPKAVLQSEVDRLLAMQPDDITRSYLVYLFADKVNASEKNVTGKHAAKINCWDTMTVPKGYFFEDQPEFKTTIGRFVFNKFILQGAGVIGVTGYIEALFGKKMVGNLDDTIADLYMNDKITRKQFNSYLDHRDTLGYWLNGMLAHTISERMLKPLPEVEKRKAELCKKYAKELEEHNVDVMNMIVDELIAYAKELLKDDPGMDLYDSGDLDFTNNYRSNAIIKGAVINKITGEFDFVPTSFMDGIDIKDLPAHANSILASQYPASIATSEAGYVGKKLIALLQMMEIDYDVEDCGTKNLIPLTITNYNKSFCTNIYINEGGQEKIIDTDNIDSYVGKTVMMRSPMSCCNNKLCKKCAGALFQKLNIKNAGLFASQLSHAALNLGLKAKHNSTVTLYSLDPENLIQDL